MSSPRGTLHRRTPRRGGLRRRGPAGHPHRLADAGLVLASVVFVALIAAIVVRDDTTEGAGRVVSSQDALITTGVGSAAPGADQDAAARGPATALIHERVRRALDPRSAVEPVVTSAELGYARWQRDAGSVGCVGVVEANAAGCVFGPRAAATTTVVLGDSMAVSYMPAVRAALATGRVHQLTALGCPPLDAPSKQIDSDAAYPECERFKPWAIQEVRRLDPDLVVLASSYRYVDGGLASGATGTAGLAEIDAGLRREIRAVSAPGRIVALLSTPPPGPNLVDCLETSAGPAACRTTAPQDWLGYAAMERRAAGATGAFFVETADWFCDGGVCPGFVGRTPVHTDGTHVSLAYAQQLAGAMREALVDVVAQARTPA